MIRVRPLGPGDDRSVEELFDATLALGHPLPFRLSGGTAYRRLCLGWYLTHGRDDAAVVEHDGRVEGYVLVCGDERSHTRWVRRRAPRFGVVAVGASLVPRRGWQRSSRFHLDRLADARHLGRRGGSPMPVHAHLNLAPGLRTGTAALDAIAHVDARCERIGAPGWYGEVNARRGRRALPLARLGLHVVGSTPNHTLSRIAGEPVLRLTVVRPLAASQLPSRAVAAAQR